MSDPADDSPDQPAPDPDAGIDPTAVRAVAERLLPGVGRLDVGRTASGGSTPVFRLRRGDLTRYLRLAERPEASLEPEALVHDRLRALGASVPEVIRFEPFAPELGRSLMLTAEIAGEPLWASPWDVDVAAILAAAGRDLAIVNQVAVAGFGWVRRDRPGAIDIAAEFPTLRAFALADLDAQLAALSPPLDPAREAALRRAVTRDDAWSDADGAVLVHGDLDPGHIYHHHGRYTGIIDFGEIRGADGLYDLGHVALHDGERIPVPMLPHLLAGYGEVVPLPPDHVDRISRWGILIALGRLARMAGRPRSSYHDFLAGALRRLLDRMPT